MEMNTGTSDFDSRDIRYDPRGTVNKLINWVFTGRKPKLLRRAMGLLLHIELPVLEHPLRVPHPFGITVNPGARIGRNVTTFQCVTLGSKRHGRKAGVPTICDDVVVYPNAVVVGGVVIGAGATIGPGAVVISDVPSGATVVGNPARIVSSRHES